MRDIFGSGRSRSASGDGVVLVVGVSDGDVGDEDAFVGATVVLISGDCRRSRRSEKRSSRDGSSLLMASRSRSMSDLKSVTCSVMSVL